jgi:GTPase
MRLSRAQASAPGRGAGLAPARPSLARAAAGAGGPARKQRSDGADANADAGAGAGAPPTTPQQKPTLADFGLGADSLPGLGGGRRPARAPQQARPALFDNAEDDDSDGAPAVELVAADDDDAWLGGEKQQASGAGSSVLELAAALERARQGLGPGTASPMLPAGGNRKQRRLAARAAAAAAAAVLSASPSPAQVSRASSDDEDDHEQEQIGRRQTEQGQQGQGDNDIAPPLLGPDGLQLERVFLVGVSVRGDDYARRARERREEQRRLELRTGRRAAFALAPPALLDDDDDQGMPQQEEDDEEDDGEFGGGGRRRRGKKGGGARNSSSNSNSSSLSTYSVDASLDELARLADTAGLHVVGRTSQSLAQPNAATYVGGGKAAEIAAAVRRSGAETVIFDDELSPAQLRNLERALNAPPPPPPPSSSASIGRRARAAMAGAYDGDDELGLDSDGEASDGWWLGSDGEQEQQQDQAEGEASGDDLDDEDDRDADAAPPPPPPPRPVAVADRTALILDIFSQRARTKEGKLQVALAQVEYQLPRVTRMWTHLDRVGGGGRVKGAGEKQLEIDRRLLRDRAALLRRELDGVRAHRAAHRARRTETPVPVVALVGYTNAGKSSLLNALVSRCGHFSSSASAAASSAPPSSSAPAARGASTAAGQPPPSMSSSLSDAALVAADTLPKGFVLAEDRLFATLDPTTRRVRLKPAGTEVLVTDTVGFIQKLPTSLVAAFRATLEEIASASVLVHVVDASSPVAQAQAEAVSAVLEEVLGGKGALARMPTVTAWNKSDAAAGGAGALQAAAAEAAAVGSGRGGGGRGGRSRGRGAVVGGQGSSSSAPSVVVVSAATGDGLDDLLAALRDRLDDGWVAFDALLPADEAGPLLSALHRGGRIEEVDWGADGPGGGGGDSEADGNSSSSSSSSSSEGEAGRSWVRVVGRAPAALAGRCARMEERARLAMGLAAAAAGRGGEEEGDDDDEEDGVFFVPGDDDDDDDDDEELLEARASSAWGR